MPQHPYTRAFLSAISSLNPDDRGKAIELSGESPSPANPPWGCRFSTRCPRATAFCQSDEPELQGNPDHRVACHYAEALLENRLAQPQAQDVLT